MSAVGQPLTREDHGPADHATSRAWTTDATRRWADYSRGCAAAVIRTQTVCDKLVAELESQRH